MAEHGVGGVNDDTVLRGFALWRGVCDFDGFEGGRGGLGAASAAEGGYCVVKK